MTFRITIVADPAPRRISVEGWLTRGEVAEFEHAIGDDPTGVCLELESLRSADRDGLTAPIHLCGPGTHLRDVPPHLL